MITSFIFSNCIDYVQILDVALNKPIKNKISELTDISYETNFEKWKKKTYTMSERRILLTQWVGQTWKEFHKKTPELIRQTFRKLRMSLAVDESENDELSIKYIPNVKVNDWRRYEEEDKVTSINSADMEDLTDEIDQGTNCFD